MWLLEKPAHGLEDSGLIWYLTSDDALRKYGLERNASEYTLYTKRYNERVLLVVPTQVDNYVYAGEGDAMTDFENYLSSRFQVGEKLRQKYAVYGTEISTDKHGS